MQNRDQHGHQHTDGARKRQQAGITHALRQRQTQCAGAITRRQIQAILDRKIGGRCMGTAAPHHQRADQYTHRHIAHHETRHAQRDPDVADTARLRHRCRCLPGSRCGAIRGCRTSGCGGSLGDFRQTRTQGSSLEQQWNGQQQHAHHLRRQNDVQCPVQ